MRFFATQNAYTFKLAIAGVSLLFTSALIIMCDPLQLLIDWQLAMRSGSLLYNLWLKPPLDVYAKIYMFNYTNVDDFMSGKAKKLKLEEAGPYTYQEILENVEVQFNENNTMTYTPKRHIKFIREMSVGDPMVDKIIAPNIPYMGVSSAASTFSMFSAIGMSALSRQLDSKPMLSMNVHDYLWGHEDRLVYLASKFVPSLIPFDRFGLMERILDEGHNVINIQLPEKPKKDSKSDKKNQATPKPRDFSIRNWNGKEGIKYWEYHEGDNATTCNSVVGDYDGTLFPRDLSETETVKVYRKCFCRSLPFEYSHRVTIDGILGYNYKMPLNAFDSDLGDPNSSCFCKGNKCLRRGLGNVTPCYFNIPIAISFPHYLGADPSLLTPFDGLHPDENLHRSDLVIQPQLGIPLHIKSRFQVEVLVNEIRYNSELSHFNNMAIPVLWVEIGMEKPADFVLILIKLVFNVLPYLQYAIMIGCLIAGSSLLLVAFLFCFWMPFTKNALQKAAREQPNQVNVESAKLQNSMLRLSLLRQPIEMQTIKESLMGTWPKNECESKLLTERTADE